MFHGTPQLSRRRLLQFAGIILILGATWPLSRASATLTVNPDAEKKARPPAITQKPPQRPGKTITSIGRARVPKPPLSFPESNGVIYTLTDKNDLLWYRHDGRDDGSFRWAASSGSKVGTGWSFKHLFAAEGGVIYAVTADGDLLWYRHDGRDDGSVRWAASAGSKVGTGWS